MDRPEISSISPFFIVRDVAASFEFYCKRLGFEVAFESEPGDLFFGIVKRGGAMIFLKDIGVEPQPNHTRGVENGIARWDAYVNVPDPDALAVELATRRVELFVPLRDTDDGLRGFEVKDADGYILFFGRPLGS